MPRNLFLPGDRVITIVDYDGIPSGTVGKVIKRWRGPAYAVKLPGGKFGWLDSVEFAPADPNVYALKEGDVGVVTSDKHRHSFVSVGDRLPVVKVVEDMSYYTVLFGDQLKYFVGIHLAKYA